MEYGIRKNFLGIGILILLISLGFSLIGGKAEAHFLLVDHNIGAVLHIDPDDNPSANVRSTFTYEFKDSQNQLDLRLCDCTFSIINGGSPIYSGKLGSDPNIKFTKDTATFSFILPTIADYTLVAEGKPAATGKFQSFKLNYDFAVTKAVAENGRAPSALALFLAGHTIHYILFGAAILISIYIVIRDKRRERIKKG